jgi:hypothetical protein
MTPKRARAIITDAHNYPSNGPWTDNIRYVMTLSERNEVVGVWDTMPRHTCFLEALYKIARTDNPKWTWSREVDIIQNES